MNWLLSHKLENENESLNILFVSLSADLITSIILGKFVKQSPYNNAVEIHVMVYIFMVLLNIKNI